MTTDDRQRQPAVYLAADVKNSIEIITEKNNEDKETRGSFKAAHLTQVTYGGAMERKGD